MARFGPSFLTIFRLASVSGLVRSFQLLPLRFLVLLESAAHSRHLMRSRVFRNIGSCDDWTKHTATYSTRKWRPKQ